ncbi:host attachment protein [Bradyrhizobium sp. U87765 SZCCT0131]|uniref:baeRF12 domain-containing protein n=1 Tax=unclassified Bradyrhizobium TaxID=2631580 RepID=UPI001BA846C0|nr:MULTISPECIES: host attachment family protein [unclassified Bradyrhizobium]MBR1218825.1 host attachment protein [Bradyrhizobium sp. U87765 SZCCT0131]MBR1261476.1 host attachment protein [Bradyrhizobium sp. U87765 SZCCT0134]MBR1306671.1 host attachment protein [Bradyrhizobium sp. U87765 SZCCT0110]MBR1317258.1 host attachment protein [Bradyrhizobium sp. U87765 SZCCT0109]MBR1350960.1 host attachment protein [Bradyrhizobium sp. U87765 SZCCT0048]
MTRLKIPHDAFVFVGDGHKALFLRNDGDELYLNLKVEQVFVDDNPPTHDQGTDRPGRTVQGADASRRSALEPTDWHALEQHHFVRHVAEAMTLLVRERQVKALVVVAPPRTLAELRQEMSAEVKSRVRAEINKDLTRHPVDDIEAHLLAA